VCSRPDCAVSAPCRLLPLLDVFLPNEAEACGIASVGEPTAVATAEEVNGGSEWVKHSLISQLRHSGKTRTARAALATSSDRPNLDSTRLSGLIKGRLALCACLLAPRRGVVLKSLALSVLRTCAPAPDVYVLTDRRSTS